MKWMLAGLTIVLLSGGCSVVEEIVRQNDDRYARLGAMDSPLTGVYNTYQFHLLDRYRVTYQWVNSSGCAVRGIERVNSDKNIRGRNFGGLHIYEEARKTWTSAGLTDIKPYDFDRFVRSVKHQQPIFATPTEEQIAASNKAFFERVKRQSKTRRLEADTPPLPPWDKPLGYKEIEVGFKALCGET